LLDIGIQTGGWKNCAPPNSANLAAKICGIKDGATVTSPLLVKASGNSPAGVNQLQVWIDRKKQYVKWGDQLSKRFTLSTGKHRIAVVANDRFIGSAKTIVNVTVPQMNSAELGRPLSRREASPQLAEGASSDFAYFTR
jgi:hypothetical protein